MTTTINTKLSLHGLWNIVNRIDLAETGEEVRARCYIAQAWVDANDGIEFDDWDALSRAIAQLIRESYHWDER